MTKKMEDNVSRYCPAPPPPEYYQGRQFAGRARLNQMGRDALMFSLSEWQDRLTSYRNWYFEGVIDVLTEEIMKRDIADGAKMWTGKTI